MVVIGFDVVEEQEIDVGRGEIFWFTNNTSNESILNSKCVKK